MTVRWLKLRSCSVLEEKPDVRVFALVQGGFSTYSHLFNMLE